MKTEIQAYLDGDIELAYALARIAELEAEALARIAELDDALARIAELDDALDRIVELEAEVKSLEEKNIIFAAIDNGEGVTE